MKYGSQEPSVLIAPTSESVDLRDGTDAARFAERFGLTLDPWQVALCELWMRRADGDDAKWLAGTWGISVPRQNGKNGTLEAIELFGMVILRLRFLHTAHEVKTARKAFRRLKHFFGEKRDDPNARFPELNRLVREMRSVNGQEAIFLFNPDTGEDLGSIELVARTEGSARGFTNDVLVIDEAQHLTDEQLEALRPAISAAPAGDPVAIYMGTPPKPEALSEEGRGAAFLRIRSRAVTGESDRAAWMEFGLDDVDLDVMTDVEVRDLVLDKANWYKVNPALGRRLFEQTIVDEIAELGVRSVARERLNVWPHPRKEGEGALSLERWAAGVVKIEDAPAEDRWAAAGLDMDPSGRVWLTIASFALDAIHVELLPEDLLANGTDRAVEQLWLKCRKRTPIVMPNDSGAAMLAAPLLAKGARVYRLSANEQAQMSIGMTQALKDCSVTHLADPVLEGAVRESGRIAMAGGQWRLARRGEHGSAPILSVACARHGAVRWSVRPNPDRDRSAGRSAGSRTAGRRTAGRR